jgi:asparagine synthase (glutamine-hydrolysing)
MCGIFGAINVNGFFTAADFERFSALNELTSYRGPDEHGVRGLKVKNSEGAADGQFDLFLGSRRLAILDLSSKGRQPMTDHTGLWIAYNGEIFNFVELRQELEASGHRFTTGTDTEVILHVYQEYGEQGFDRLNGMWAFALVDLPDRRVVLSRDRFSIKPLYTLSIEGCIYFASEIKQLLPLLPSRRLNMPVMSAFLCQGLLDHSRETFFEGIVRVPPRTNITISMDTGAVHETRYWNFKRTPGLAFNAPTAELFRNLFLDSIRLRLRSDVKVGVLLSGGLDSSSIAVGCEKLAGNQLDTYSVVSDDGCYDEHEFIDALARTGVRNHKVAFGHVDALEDLDCALYHSDEPVGGFSVIAQYKLFGAIKRDTDVTVLLSGQGGDEVLLGYLKFFFFYLQSLYHQGRYSQALMEFAASLWRGTIVHQFTLRSARRYIPALAHHHCDAFRTAHKTVPVWECADITSRQELDIEKYSVPALTHYEDRNSMAHSLEVRHPFLDHRLVEFLLNLPAEWKIHNGWTKYVLRQAMSELPKEIRWRLDKQGFLTPEQQWLKKDLQTVIRSSFHKSSLSEAGILDDEKFLRYYDQFQKGAPVPYSDIARTLIAEQWMRKVF